MLPRKSTRAAQISLSLEKPISEENEVIDAPTQDKPVREKEEPTKKNKTQKQDEDAKPTEAGVKAMGKEASSKPTGKEKVKQPEKKEKLRQKKVKKLVKKRKKKLDNLDIIKRTETRTKKRLTKGKP